jgi:hypothetical protein
VYRFGPRVLPLSQVLEETRGGEDTRYLYGLQRLAALDTAAARTWELHDALGSVRQTLDDAGAHLPLTAGAGHGAQRMFGDMRRDEWHLGDLVTLRGGGVGQVGGQVSLTVRALLRRVRHDLIDLLGRQILPSIRGLATCSASFQSIFYTTSFTCWLVCSVLWLIAGRTQHPTKDLPEL